MLYQELRPQSISALFGNNALKSALLEIIERSPSDRPHTYLFTGPSGTGKTTIARILADEFGCTDINLQELNGSDNRGIDDARTVIETAQLAPLGGSCRVFIWDEFHQGTKDCQNALLKIIEDTPESVYFIFCTTNPEKILKTIKNRCSVFETECLNDDDMALLLNDAIDAAVSYYGEHYEINDGLLSELVVCSEGSPRRALVLLEQLSTIRDDVERRQILKKAVIEKDVIELCRVMLKNPSWKEVSAIYQTIPDKDPEMIRRSMLGYMKVTLLKSGRPAASVVIDNLKEHTFDSGEAGLVNGLFNSIIDIRSLS